MVKQDGYLYRRTIAIAANPQMRPAKEPPLWWRFHGWLMEQNGKCSPGCWICAGNRIAAAMVERSEGLVTV